MIELSAVVAAERSGAVGAAAAGLSAFIDQATLEAAILELQYILVKLLMSRITALLFRTERLAPSRVFFHPSRRLTQINRKS